MKFDFISKNSLKNICLFFLILPIILYLVIVNRYSVNTPFYDDITQIIWILNEIIDPKMDSPFVTLADTPDKIHALFYPNAGHIPLFTRLFALAQYALGGINFKTSIMAANIGWVATCSLLLWYANRKLCIPAYFLLPIPWLMMAISHWEAMNMTLGGWQMYWGSAFFPVAVLMCLVEGYITLATVFYFGALLTSGGGLCLYPLGLCYLLLTKRWRDCVLFALLAGLSVAVFLFFNPVSANVRNAATPDPYALTQYALAFVGNIATSGEYGLQPLATIHQATALTLIIGGLFFLVRTKNSHLPKLIFLYVIILAYMVAYKRMHISYVVPRYSAFALLFAVSIYLLIAKNWLVRAGKPGMLGAGITAVACVGFWIYAYKSCSVSLEQDLQSRAAAMQQFRASGDASGLMWNGPWASEILHEAQRLHVYDYNSDMAITPR